MTGSHDLVHSVWTDSLDDLVSYRYLGCSSVLRDDTHAEGHMRLRRDLRTPAGLLAAPIAIATLDTAGINIDRRYHLALTHVEIALLDAGAGVEAVRVLGSVVREARTQVFTEARIEDADDASRTVAVGTADWEIIAPTPEGFEYTDPGPGVEDSPELPPLTEAYDAQPRASGGFTIAGLSPRVGTDVLHHGPMLVTLEGTALQCATECEGIDALRVEHLGMRIVKAGRSGPFVTDAEVLTRLDDSIMCRATLRDEGGEGCLVAAAMVRARMV
jgi:acyl-coenzyme A thioesterase PaaI-like protein